MARNYSAEYAARNERAIERGYKSYAQERSLRERHSETIEALREEYDLKPGQTYDVREIAYEYELSEWQERAEDAGSREEWGSIAHDMVAWLMDEWDMTEEEAVAEMYELIGG